MSEVKKFWIKVTTGSGFPFWETEITDNEELKNQYEDFNDSVCVVSESKLLAEQEKVNKLKEACKLVDYQFSTSFGDAETMRSGISKMRQALKEVECV